MAKSRRLVVSPSLVDDFLELRRVSRPNGELPTVTGLARAGVFKGRPVARVLSGLHEAGLVKRQRRKTRVPRALDPEHAKLARLLLFAYLKKFYPAATTLRGLPTHTALQLACADQRLRAGLEGDSRERELRSFIYHLEDDHYLRRNKTDVPITFCPTARLQHHLPAMTAVVQADDKTKLKGRKDGRGPEIVFEGSWCDLAANS